jgi:hypothetical protein
LFLVQRFALLASPQTTVVSTHLPDDELTERVRDLPC